MSRPRLIVTTDITSVKAGFKEPDDCQSLVRLLSMSDEYEIEGLIASSRLGHGQDVCPDHIEHVVNAYGHVERQLRKHSAGFPKAAPPADADQGRPADRQTGSAGGGEHWRKRGHRWLELDHFAAEAEIGSAALGHCVGRDGGPGAVRLADSRVVAGRGIRRSCDRGLRVYSIGDQDSTGPWIRAEFPDVFYIIACRVYRGVYRWGDTKLCTSEWVQDERHQGRRGIRGGVS